MTTSNHIGIWTALHLVMYTVLFGGTYGRADAG